MSTPRLDLHARFNGSQPPPVGVRLLDSFRDHAEVPAYQGVSYCDAVHRAGKGQALRVLPGSLRVCRWAPPVLGLKAPANGFERHLAPALPCPTAGLLLAPLDIFPGRPQIVIVRARPAVLRRAMESAALAEENGVAGLLWNGHRGRMEWSVVPFFTGEPPSPHYQLVQTTNEFLGWLARSNRWRAFTFWLFRSQLPTFTYDAFIKRTLADMSVCRNSTVIPLLSGRVNVSFFCSGGVTWGLNNPAHLTSGWPWRIYRRLAASVWEG